MNEFSTLNGYHRLIARTEHPVMIDLLERVIKDERRHFAFYRAQAKLRLTRSRSARRITRWGMEHLWAPVGTGVRPQSETDFVVAYLFGDEEGMATARAMDASMSELPGLEGITLAQDSVHDAIQRIGPVYSRKPSELDLGAAPVQAN
jgi:hypothetical protein